MGKFIRDLGPCRTMRGAFFASVTLLLFWANQSFGEQPTKPGSSRAEPILVEVPLNLQNVPSRAENTRSDWAWRLDFDFLNNQSWEWNKDFPSPVVFSKQTWPRTSVLMRLQTLEAANVDVWAGLFFERLKSADPYLNIFGPVLKAEWSRLGGSPEVWDWSPVVAFAMHPMLGISSRTGLVDSSSRFGVQGSLQAGLGARWRHLFCRAGWLVQTGVLGEASDSSSGFWIGCGTEQ